MPALISVAEAEDIDLSNPELIIIVMPAGSEECYYVVLYLLYSKIKQLIWTVTLLIWHRLHDYTFK